MKPNLEESDFLEKIRDFERMMIKTIKNNEEVFEFNNKQYNVYPNGVFVQTLIEGKILYRIYMEEEKNDDSVRYDLMNHMQGITADMY